MYGQANFPSELNKHHIKTLNKIAPHKEKKNKNKQWRAKTLNHKSMWVKTKSMWNPAVELKDKEKTIWRGDFGPKLIINHPSSVEQKDKDKTIKSMFITKLYLDLILTPDY